jgi:sugar phosphate isomerase/epimerase
MFHPSIEAAQHGPKGLEGFVEFAMQAGAVGCQPSNFMLEDGKGDFLPASKINEVFEDSGLLLDGISAHCPFWVHTTAWTESKTILPFIPAEVAQMSPEGIEAWAESHILRLFDLCGELGVYVIPMFWGVAFGWELASGYPWGMWQGPGYDLAAEGTERFVEKTDRIRDEANKRGIYLAHEIHPGTAAMCADDFLQLVAACGFDDCLAVNADPSHCWEGESWQDRFSKVGKYIYGVHVKNNVVLPGLPLRSMNPNWQNRAMQFTDLPTGDINLTRFVELMYKVGYAQRYCDAMNRESAPLVTEAESAFRDLNATAAQAIAYTRDVLCFPFATESFEKGMGAAQE